MKSKKALYLSLPAPCEKSWNEMQPVPGGKHCSSCSKTIIDFSLLTDAEIFAAINNSRGAVCGRFADDQLHRQITAPVPPRHSVMPAMLVTAGLAVGIATAGHAAPGKPEQIEMSVFPVPVADTGIVAKPRDLPEVVVTGFARSATTGVVCVTYTEIKSSDKPLEAHPIAYKNEPITKKKKKKKRFLFF